MRANPLLLVVALALACAEAAAAPAAEIVTLQGKGDYRESGTADWRPAKREAAARGGAVRAHHAGREQDGAAARRPDADDAAGRLDRAGEAGRCRGRASRSSSSARAPGASRPRRRRRTSASARPRGLPRSAAPSGWSRSTTTAAARFTVVEGELDISNDLGSISVGADEQGVLERGKAPSKHRLQNARERVQWVSSFTIDPARYPSPATESAAAAIRQGEIARARDLLAAAIARDGAAPEAYFLASEVELYFGRGREALALMDRAAARFPNEPRVPGLTARAALFADDFPRARAAAADALARFPDTLESQLAAGEVARLDGDSRRRAAGAAARDAHRAEGLARVACARARCRPNARIRGAARRALDEADKLSPDNAHVLGELGLVEANAYDLPRARALLDRAQAAQPDDFATWTALGFARLKSGDTEGALEALLKATLLEPRSAKAHVYLAVVYWQQGRADDAFAMLRTASLNDPKDPLPYQFAAMMHADLLQPGDALADAREAVARLAYVKSLDAIANDLRGAANLGAPLAQLGLEAWALKNAQDSFDPALGRQPPLPRRPAPGQVPRQQRARAGLPLRPARLRRLEPLPVAHLAPGKLRHARVARLALVRHAHGRARS